MLKTVVLLSGGVDSVTAAAIAKHDNLELYALSFDYGQTHKIELESAIWQAREFLKVKGHTVINCDMRDIGGSALTGSLEIPLNRNLEKDTGEIPATYVPARNTIFLSFALALSEVVGAKYIYTGFNAVDYSGYPDCRPKFVSAFQHMAALATKATDEGGSGVEIRTPLIEMTKREIVLKGMELAVDYKMTWSCYSPLDGKKPCSMCDSCRYRAKGFLEAGYEDPLMSRI